MLKDCERMREEIESEVKMRYAVEQERNELSSQADCLNSEIRLLTLKLSQVTSDCAEKLAEKDEEMGFVKEQA